MKIPLPFHCSGLAGLLCLLVATAAAADEAGLQRCRAIPEAGARLACYDALPLRAVATPTQGPAAALAPPTAVPPAVATGGPATVQNFGQERRDEPQTISSHIAGAFEGWGPNSRIKLANGQVWQVIDGSEGVYFLQNPKVTVRRALMGGFQLDIEGAKRTPRVRRLE